jgi:hypothetical protein
VADFLLRSRQLLLPGFARQVVDRGNDLLDGRMRGFERLDRLFLGDFLGARFHHHQPVFRAGDDEVEFAVFALLERGIDDELAVDETDANAGDRLLEGNLGERECRGGAGNRQDVGVVLLIRGEDQRDDLRLVAPAGGEERTDRPIDTAARQDFFLGGLAFAFEEAAGNAARRVGVFAVIDRQRQEIDPLARARRRQAVTSTTESPKRTLTEPPACFASLPVSSESVC